MQGEQGVCPSCLGAGTVGALCEEPGCQRRGVHCIPHAYMPQSSPTAAPVVTDPVIGQEIGGDYLVVDTVGAGGFGRVVLALQAPLFRLKTALKLLDMADRDPALADAMIRKFEGEAEALAVLNHPNIVRLLKYGHHEGQPYLVMEYVEGGRTLKSEVRARVREGGGVDTRFIRHIARQLLNALAAAHAREIVHRDIKPENIMLQEVEGDASFVRVLDFGLAKFVGESAQTSTVMGTPVYMAPEQLSGDDIGPWTDLYAVGVILFELVSGRRAFPGSTQQEIIARKIDERYDPVDLLEDTEVPEATRAFLRHALSRDRAQRFQSAPEMRDALDALLRSQQTVAIGEVPPGELSGLFDVYASDRGQPERGESAPPESTSRTPVGAALPSKRRWSLWVGLAVIVAAAVVGVVLAILMSGPSAETPVAASSAAASPTTAPSPGTEVERPPVQPSSSPAGSLDRDALAWVALPAGTFQMGAADERDDERPVHSVSVAAFEVTRTEVTVAQYTRCVEAGRCSKPKMGQACNWGEAGRDEHPVNGVDWTQAGAFCAWAGGRLPSEAEWEYAARSAGKIWAFPWGEQPATCERAVMDGGERDGGDGCGTAGTWPVCSRPTGATAQGLCDMAGNVWEWVQDVYVDSYEGAPVDGAAREVEDGRWRVFRGGSWRRGSDNLRATRRAKRAPSYRSSSLGFRCAR